MEQSAQFFQSRKPCGPLGIVAMNGAQELADKIEAHLVRWANPAGMKSTPSALAAAAPVLPSDEGHSGELRAGL